MKTGDEARFSERKEKPEPFEDKLQEWKEEQSLGTLRDDESKWELCKKNVSEEAIIYAQQNYGGTKTSFYVMSVAAYSYDRGLKVDQTVQPEPTAKQASAMGMKTIGEILKDDENPFEELSKVPHISKDFFDAALSLEKKEADYWKERCEAAEAYIEESPCDPDIYPKQLENRTKPLKDFQANG